MRSDILLFGYLLLFVAISCHNTPSPTKEYTSPQLDSTVTAIVQEPVKPIDYDTTQWRDIADFIPGIILELRYATSDNFIGDTLYPCSRCFLRPDVAIALKRVVEWVNEQGMSIKLFDCYRPLAVQKKMWEKYPNPRYVMRPEKGSMHNRGMALDLTLLDSKGQELDMGTPFDAFDPKSHHDASGLSTEVVRNRTLLKKLMSEAGFKSIRTEWWHYSYKGKKHPVANWVWACDDD